MMMPWFGGDFQRESGSPCRCRVSCRQGRLRNPTYPNCLSFGMTANHVTAGVVPVLGGIAWSIFGYQVTLIAGAAIVFVDLLFALRVPVTYPMQNTKPTAVEPG